MDKPHVPDKHTEPTEYADHFHLSRDRAQASAIQCALAATFIDFRKQFGQTQELPLRHGIAETMQGLARTWRDIVAVRRDILGKPRAGSLTPAERAAMRQRKSQRSSQRAPTLAKPVVAAKESLSAP